MNDDSREILQVCFVFQISDNRANVNNRQTQSLLLQCGRISILPSLQNLGS